MKYHYCLVKIYGIKKEYYYMDESQTLSVGDIVEIPFGEKNTIVEATVTSINVCELASVPYPLNKTKKILRKLSHSKSYKFQNISNGKLGLYDSEMNYVSQPVKTICLVNSMEDIHTLLDKIKDLNNIPLLEKMKYAAYFDPYRLQFGADSHNYKLRRVLSDNEIQRFEKVYGVTLPKEYKDYLTQIGNGNFHYGSISEYGLNLSKYNKEYELLKEEFPYTDEVNLDDFEDDCINCDDCDDCPQKNKCITSYWFNNHKYDTFRYQKGTLQVSYEGCDYWHRLVITGPKRGSVWSESEVSGMTLVYDNYNDFANASADSYLKPAIKFYNCLVNNDSIENLINDDSYFSCSRAERIKYSLGLLGVMHKELIGIQKNLDEEKYYSELLERVNMLKKVL